MLALVSWHGASLALDSLLIRRRYSPPGGALGLILSLLLLEAVLLTYVQGEDLFWVLGITILLGLAGVGWGLLVLAGACGPASRAPPASGVGGSQSMAA